MANYLNTLLLITLSNIIVLTVIVGDNDIAWAVRRARGQS
jgi:hypothetical protein